MAKSNQNKLFADHLAVAVKGGKVNRTKSISEFIAKNKGDENVNPRSLEELDLDNPTKEMVELSKEVIKKRTKINNKDLEDAIKKIAGSEANKSKEKSVKAKKNTYRAGEY